MEAVNNNSSLAGIRVPSFAPQFAPRSVELYLLYEANFFNILQASGACIVWSLMSLNADNG